MVNKKEIFGENEFNSPFASGHFNPKKAHYQVNGETKPTQSLIKLKRTLQKTP
ncbi:MULTISPECIES: YpzG family protein [Cytobacillus]|uniref:YpzG family protein n=1 Tax=Cytobacillus stercorigallinarum TaxID=2762240 RepID=A0ABR8QVD9_9BACI|nr:YpzG family protein [Cytobacillus stercorigallinarum]MBD7939501.1 YpzG family protein [Cytobacillus stercorigallinarum]